MFCSCVDVGGICSDCFVVSRCPYLIVEVGNLLVSGWESKWVWPWTKIVWPDVPGRDASLMCMDVCDCGMFSTITMSLWRIY